MDLTPAQTLPTPDEYKICIKPNFLHLKEVENMLHHTGNEPQPDIHIGGHKQTIFIS